MTLTIEQVEKAFDAWAESLKITNEEKVDAWHGFMVKLIAVYGEGK